MTKETVRRLVIFGGTGDLAGRYLLPALAALQAAGDLDAQFELVCSDRKNWSHQQFHQWAREWLDSHAADILPAARRKLLAAARHQRADITDPGQVRAAMAGEGPLVVYLALAPGLYETAIQAVRQAGLPPGSRIAIEKPFGEDFAHAQRLNRLLAETVPEEAVFRIDHFLAMTAVQNVLVSRLSNELLAAAWNGSHIAEIHIVWEETLTAAGRAGFYDNTGALGDMLQSHLLQVLCMVAMEPPKSFSEHDLRDRKVEVLEAIRPVTDAEIPSGTRRARYSAGRIDGQEIPGYLEEQGVDSCRETETFAEVTLRIETPRWSGTKFVLRSGKALERNCKEVAVCFRAAASSPLDGSNGSPFHRDDEPAGPNVVRFGLEPEQVAMELTSIGPSVETLRPLTLRCGLHPPQLPAYAQLLHDIFRGDPALFLRADEAELSWRVVAPVVSAWSRNLVPMEEYPAGSGGPAGQK